MQQALAAIKSRVTDKLPFDVDPTWVVMNAPRPLAGHLTTDSGEFLTGRFYAAIDPADSMAAAYLETNTKLDACVVVIASKAVQVEMALVGSRYADRYRNEFTGDDLYKAVSPDRHLRDLPFSEMQSRLIQAKSLATN